MNLVTDKERMRTRIIMAWAILAGLDRWITLLSVVILVIQVSTDDDGDKLRRPFYKYLFTKIYNDII